MMLKVHIIAFVLHFSFFCMAQEELSIKFIGNCALHITDGSTNIYTDFPYKSGAYGYMRYSQIEIDSIKNNATFLFTHKHADHYSRKIFKNFLKDKNCHVFTQWKKRKLLKHLRGRSDIDIQVFKTKHRFSIKHHSYLITWNGKRIYLSGDAESADTIAKLKNLDWAFVPPWLLDDAKSKGIKIDADKIGVYHLYPSEAESALEEWGSRADIIPLVKQGDTMELR